MKSCKQKATRFMKIYYNVEKKNQEKYGMNSCISIKRMFVQILID